MVFQRSGAIHQPLHGRIDHLPALPEDVDGDKDRQQRVENVPAGEHRQHQPDDDAGGSRDIGEDVPPIRLERGRLVARPGGDEQPGPKSVDCGRRAVDRKAQRGLLHRYRIEERQRCLAGNQQRRDHDQHALDHGGQIFRLVVAVRMLRVGGRMADADRIPGDRGGDHVDDRLQRVGIECHRAGKPPGNELQPHHRECNDDGPCGNALDLLLHAERHDLARQPSPWPCAADARPRSRSCACRRSGPAS
jgi:hypothetical protein